MAQGPHSPDFTGGDLAGDDLAGDDLVAAAACVWRLLARGAADRRSGLHTVSLATVDHTGMADARTVVLRGVDGAAGQLWAHSDRRAAKVGQIAHDPRGTILAYDPGMKLQVRIAADLTVLTRGKVADAAWRQSTLWARRCYLAPHGPSAPVDAPTGNLPDGLADREPTATESEAGRGNFCVIMATVKRIDWLYLDHAGHRRGEAARTAGTDDTPAWTYRWLAP